MRWKAKIKKEKHELEVRVVSKFLFLPRTFGGETRWLEQANMQETCIRRVSLVPECPVMMTYLEWVETGFADEAPQGDPNVGNQN